LAVKSILCIFNSESIGSSCKCAFVAPSFIATMEGTAKPEPNYRPSGQDTFYFKKPFSLDIAFVIEQEVGQNNTARP
jgi:hypothetical protein